MTSDRNILIVRTDRMGDVILSTPVIKALRDVYPQAKISILVASAMRGLVDGNPYLDEVMVEDRQGRHKYFWGFLRLVLELRRKRYDLAVILHVKRRTNLLCFLAGIPKRVGYYNRKYGALLTEKVEDLRHLGEKHESEYSLDILRAMGLSIDQREFYLPVDSEAEQWADHWVSKNNISPQDPLIAIHANATDPTRLWPDYRFAELIDRLIEQYAAKIILVGGADNEDMIAGIRSRIHHNIFDLTGQTSIPQFISLIRRCWLLISNESGPVHIAATVGIPVISLFLRNQPGINIERWRPLGEKSHVICNQPGEVIRVDAKGKVLSGSFDAIQASDVLEKTDAILR